MATSWFWIANFVLDPKEGAMCDPASAKPRRHAPGRPIFQSVFGGIAASILLAAAPGPAGTTVAQAAKPNIIFIMGDDIGWFNIGAYHQGMMAGKTPNLDQLAAEGMRFTDYYAEPSCTAGRANFITGELPLRTGLTTVGQAGADVGMPAEAPTIATALKAMGYATGQFGKNHLGDLNKYLPTVHGFDEYFGYLYHLDAMEDPFWHSYPPELVKEVGPRNLVHTFRDQCGRSGHRAALGQDRQAKNRGRRAFAAASHRRHQI
jgi:arylsulfatase A-like enzyme